MLGVSGVRLVDALGREPASVTPLVAPIAQRGVAGHAGPETWQRVAKPDSRGCRFVAKVAGLRLLVDLRLAAEGRMYGGATWERRPRLHIAAASFLVLFVLLDLLLVVLVDGALPLHEFFFRDGFLSVHGNVLG